MPSELDDIRRKIMQHEIEEAALKKETDRISVEHLAEVQQELAEMRSKFNEMKAKWENERNAISKVQKLREEIESTNSLIEQAERSYDLNKAAELKYGKLLSYRRSLRKKKSWQSSQSPHLCCTIKLQRKRLLRLSAAGQVSLFQS